MSQDITERKLPKHINSLNLLRNSSDLKSIYVMDFSKMNFDGLGFKPFSFYFVVEEVSNARKRSIIHSIYIKLFGICNNSFICTFTYSYFLLLYIYTHFMQNCTTESCYILTEYLSAKGYQKGYFFQFKQKSTQEKVQVIFRYSFLFSQGTAWPTGVPRNLYLGSTHIFFQLSYTLQVLDPFESPPDPDIVQTHIFCPLSEPQAEKEF